jgi:hypothetical protein
LLGFWGGEGIDHSLWEELNVNQIRWIVTGVARSLCLLTLVSRCLADSDLCDLQWVQHVPGVYFIDSPIHDLVVFDDGITGPALYAGGGFFVAGGIGANNIAKWNGSSWWPLAAPLPELHSISAMCVFDDGGGPELFVAASVDFFGSPFGDYRVAKWDGATWTIMPGVFDNQVYVLRSVDMGAGPTLYAGGRFEQISGQPRLYLARWTGTEWAQVWSTVSMYSSPFTGVFAIEVFDEDGDRQPEMFVGGGFHSVNGVPCFSLARWDGSSWSGFGPLSGDILYAPGVSTLVVHDDGSGPALIVGGRFDTVAGVTVNSIAKWNGASWAPLGGGFHMIPIGCCGLHLGIVHALLSFVDDPAASPRLFASGHFHLTDGLSVPGIARWDGRAWSPMGSGINFETPSVLAGFDDGSPLGPAVYINLNPIGPQFADSRFFAKWQRVKHGGPADLDCDTHVSGYDLAMLLGDWGDCPKRGECAADLDGDGVVNGIDLAMLLNEWG